MNQIPFAIKSLRYYLPTSTVATSEGWGDSSPSNRGRLDRLGISQRHIAGTDECASDLACEAAQQLFASGECNRAEVDFVLFCTQSADYILPTTACLLQDRLALRTGIGALDFNLGCSGYVYGLGLATGLLATGQAKCVLLLTGDTYSKYINPRDWMATPLFGDAGTATCVTSDNSGAGLAGPFIYGTDGSGGPHLIIPTGGQRVPRTAATAVEATDSRGAIRSQDNLSMNGKALVDFVLTRVPKALAELLDAAGVTQNDIDLFVFHQPNGALLHELRNSLGIEASRFQITLSHCANTVSSSIPIALRHALTEGRLRRGYLVALVGFGVGFSWAATLIRWNGCE